jgi:hypothetical protein
MISLYLLTVLIKETLNLNWIDRNGILSSLDSLNPVTQNKFLYSCTEISNNRRKPKSKCFYGSYYSNSSIISLSSWSRSKKYVFCGCEVEGIRKNCNQHRYCEKCADYKSRQIYYRFNKAHYKAQNWYSLTTCTKAEYLARWDEGNDFIKSLYKEHYIDGAIIVDELSIPGLVAQHVFPHVHAIITSTDSDLIQTINNLKGSRNIVIRKVEDMQDLQKVIRYPVKAINLQSIYEEELHSYSPAEINNSINSLLETTTDFEYKYTRIKYLGILNSKTKQYIGTKKPSKKKRLKKTIATTTINCMDQITTQKAAKALIKKANQFSVSGYPTTQQQPQPKKRSTLANAGLLAGGIGGLGIGADLLFNKGQLTRSGITQGAKGLAHLGVPQAVDYLKKNHPTLVPDTNIAADREGFRDSLLNADLAGREAYHQSVPPMTEGATALRDITNTGALATLPLFAGAGATAGAGVLARRNPTGVIARHLGQAPSSALPSGVHGPVAPGTALPGSGVLRHTPTIMKNVARVGPLAGAAAGNMLANDPLIREVQEDGGVSGVLNHPATATLLAGAASTNPVTLLATLLGTVATKGVSVHAQNNLENLYGQMAANDLNQEQLLSLYRAAKEGTPGARYYLDRWLQANADRDLSTINMTSPKDGFFSKALTKGIFGDLASKPIHNDPLEVLRGKALALPR